MLYKLLLLTTLSSSILPVCANEVDIEQALFKKYLGLCEASIKEKKCTETKYCQDLADYRRYLYKDSAVTYFNYNLDAGNINKRNIGLFNSNAERLNKILELGIVGCE